MNYATFLAGRSSTLSCLAWRSAVLSPALPATSARTIRSHRLEELFHKFATPVSPESRSAVLTNIVLPDDRRSQCLAYPRYQDLNDAGFKNKPSSCIVIRNRTIAHAVVRNRNRPHQPTNVMRLVHQLFAEGKRKCPFEGRQYASNVHYCPPAPTFTAPNQNYCSASSNNQLRFILSPDQRCVRLPFRMRLQK